MNQSSDLGWDALSREDFVSAEKQYVQAVEFAHKLNDRTAEAVFLSYLAMALKGQGQMDEARRHFDLAMNLAEQDNDLRVIGHVCYLLAEMARGAADECTAISLLWRALDSALAVGDGETAEVALGLLGEIYRNRGWLEQSSECFRQAAELGSGMANRIAWLGNLGQTLAEMGDFKGALLRFQEALELAEETGDEKSKSYCKSSEALVYFEEGDLERALACMQEALILACKIKDRRAESCLLGNLGNVYLRLKQVDRASEFCRQALDLARECQDKRSEAAHMDSLGDCHMQNGEIEKALSCYKKAVEESQAIFDRLGERVYRSNQGRALRRLGRADEALQQLAAAANLFEEQRARIIQSDSLKTSFASTGHQIYKDIISLCLENGNRVEALEYVGRAKSRAMLDLLSNSPIDIADMENIDDDSIARLIEKEFELRGQIAALERMFGQVDSDGGHRGSAATAADVPRLYRQWHDVVDQLRRRHPSYASMVSVDPLTYNDLSALWQGEPALLSGTDAVVEFFWSDGLFLTAALWSGLAQPLMHLVSEEEQVELENDLNDFLEMSSTEGWEVPVGLCHRLYARLLAPVVSAMPAGIDRIILVPHAALHKLPFAALHDGEKFLIEKYALSILPSASLIKLLGERRQVMVEGDTRYLISAISDYSATREDGVTYSSRLRSASGLVDLDYTIEEGKTVFGLASRHVADTRFFANQDVKEALFEQFRECSVIHFAGHAIFNPEEPLASGLVLSDGSVLTAARILQDSAFRTGKGRLLILSACQTGANVITSGGDIVGLARALFYAGMPNLISSLWEVADRSTAQLMQDFHSLWQTGKISISKALQEAQSMALKKGLPVHAWAPFIHLGID